MSSIVPESRNPHEVFKYAVYRMPHFSSLQSEAVRAAREQGLKVLTYGHEPSWVVVQKEGLPSQPMYRQGHISMQQGSFLKKIDVEVGPHHDDLSAPAGAIAVVKNLTVKESLLAVRVGIDLDKVASVLFHLHVCMAKSSATECAAPFQPREPA